MGFPHHRPRALTRCTSTWPAQPWWTACLVQLYRLIYMRLPTCSRRGQGQLKHTHGQTTLAWVGTMAGLTSRRPHAARWGLAATRIHAEVTTDISNHQSLILQSSDFPPVSPSLIPIAPSFR